MDNQHKLIKGYRDLSAEEIALMDEIKEHAEAMRALVSKVVDHLGKTCTYVKAKDAEGNELSMTSVSSSRFGTCSQGFDENTVRWLAAQPYDWLERAKDELQDGFMKLTRAVAQPTTF